MKCHESDWLFNIFIAEFYYLLLLSRGHSKLPGQWVANDPEGLQVESELWSNCASGWSESSLGAHAVLKELLCPIKFKSIDKWYTNSI